MPYIRSRKFCCCLPVRFGVFCEGLIGLVIGGFFSVAGWLEISRMLKGTLDLTHSEKISLWAVAITMTIFALTSLMGIIGSIGRIRALVAIYATTITAVTVVNVAAGIFFIYNLFHGDENEQLQKCEANAQGGNADVTNWVCNAGFKTGRAIVVVIYVLFWLVEIYGCVIAFEYVGQLSEEEDAERRDYEKSVGSAPNVTIVNQQQPPYAFAAAQNSYGRA